jgi:hypothetical protein
MPHPEPQYWRPSPQRRVELGDFEILGQFIERVR